MKKLIALLLSLAMVVALASCGSSASVSTGTPVIRISAALPYRCWLYVAAFFCFALWFAVRNAELMFTGLPKWVRMACSSSTSSLSMKMGSEPSRHANSFTLK